MFFDGFDNLLEVFILTVLMFFSLIIVFRIAGKRTITELNSFDVVLSITIGSVGASIITSDDFTFLEGLIAISTIALLQYIISKLDEKFDFINKKLKSDPTLLYYKGEFLRDNMKEKRITERDILQEVRLEANTGIRGVCAVLLEGDGEISVIKDDVKDEDLDKLEEYK